MRKHNWVIKSLSIAVCGALLSACGGSSSGGGDNPSAEYTVQYQAPEEAFIGAEAQLNLLASNSKGNLLAIKSQSVSKYSVRVEDNPAFIVNNECKEVTLGQPCKIMLSLSEQAKEKNIFNFEITLPNGQKKSYSHVFLKKSILTNVSQESVLPTQKNNTITIVNNSRQTMYIDKPQFFGFNGEVIPEVKITHNSCQEEIPPSSECQFNIRSGKKVDGQLKLLSALPIIKSLSFSDVVVKTSKTEDIPANSVRGMSYPFAYSFTNTSSQLPATNVHFTYNFPEGTYSFDKKESTCLGINKLAANETCIWKGTFESTSEGDKPLSILLDYAEGSKVELDVNSHVSGLSIQGEKLEDLPVNAAKGRRYPFVYMFTNTNDTLMATGIHFTKVFSDGDYKIDHVNSTCEGIKGLAPKTSCTWQGVFEPNSTGDKNMVATLSYQGGQDVVLHSHSNVSELEVVGQKLKDLPENTAQGRSYPFTYAFTNLSKHFTAKGVAFSNVFPADYHIDDANSSCKNIQELAPGVSCLWQGEFKPTKTGHQLMSSVLHYEGGEDVALNSSSQVTGVVITAQKAEEIPENVVKDKSYPFHYIFQNTSKTTSATNVSFTQDFPGGEYVFDKAASTCMNINALSANATCSWVGVFTPKTNGIKSHSMILHYTEGKDIKLNGSSVVSEVGIGVDEILGVPVNTSTGSSYPFNYVFTNLSSKHKATGISFTNIFPDSFVVDAEKSTCLGVSELAPNASCSWQGTFEPVADEDTAWSIALHYQEGKDVILKKSTTSSSVAIDASKTIDLPENMAKGVSYPFTYTFMNLNEFNPATNVSFTNLFPAGVTIDKDKSTCNGITELKANQSCSWVGTVTPALETSSYVIGSTLHYQQGSDIALQTNSQVSKVDVEGALASTTPEIQPGNFYYSIRTGLPVMLKYTFTNKSDSLPATGVALNWENGVYDPSDTSSCLKLKNNTLLPHSSCDMYFTVSSDIPGNLMIPWVKFSYNEGLDVKVSPSIKTFFATSPINNNPTERFYAWEWPKNRFIPASDHTAGGGVCRDALYDRLTNLEWTIRPQKRGKWDEVNTAAEQATYCNQTNWRLPTVNELMSILSYRADRSISSELTSAGFKDIFGYTPLWTSNKDYADSADVRYYYVNVANNFEDRSKILNSIIHGSYLQAFFVRNVG